MWAEQRGCSLTSSGFKLCSDDLLPASLMSFSTSSLCAAMTAAPIEAVYKRPPARKVPSRLDRYLMLTKGGDEAHLLNASRQGLHVFVRRGVRPGMPQVRLGCL